LKENLGKSGEFVRAFEGSKRSFDVHADGED